MKTVTISAVLVFSSLALCEVPTSYYPQRPVRFNPHFREKFETERASGSLDVKVPSRLTIEQLIRLTEQLQSPHPKPQKLGNQNSYFNSQPHQTYGPPDKLQLRPPSWPQQPQQSYGPPDKVQLRPPSQPQTSCQFQRPQAVYGLPNKPQTQPPSTNYGVPDIRNVETLGEQQGALRQNLNELKGQDLPYKSPSGFKAAHPPNREYLAAAGSSEAGQPQTPLGGGISTGSSTFGKPNVYLPPKTTTLRPSTVATTTVAGVDGLNPSDYDYDDQQTTEAPVNTGGPNISVATAVAGGDRNFFYLQQPDGKLQRVMVQKIRDPKGKPEEYVANYYFQNVQPVPNTVYTPLITLGSFVR